MTRRIGIVIAVALVCAGTASAAWNWWADAMRGAAQRTAGAAYTMPGFSASIHWFRQGFWTTNGAGQVADYSVQGTNTGTFLAGQIPVLTNAYGGTVYFNGNSCITLANVNATTRPSGGAFTTAIWLRPDNNTEASYFWSEFDGTYERYIIQNGTALRGACNGNVNILIGPSPGAGTWRHVVFTVTTQRLESLYVDGLLSISNTCDAIRSATSGSLGRRSWQNAYPQKGFIGDFYLCNYAWTSNEVWTTFNAQKTGYGL
jgi:hypothetical protein